MFDVDIHWVPIVDRILVHYVRGTIILDVDFSTHDIMSEPKRDSKARTASAAVFFNDNKAIAGFGNSMRSLFTSVRELVENSLDAAEKRGVTPNIVLKMRKLEKKELIELMGSEAGIKTRETRIDFIELSCKDNGVGVPRALIPQLFGTVLAGTKYGVQQTRGRFGLGSKMVLLHAMSTLDLPIQITTRPEGDNATYRIKLFIDLEKNAPIIRSDEKFEEGHEEYFEDYGTEIKVSFTGSWTLAKNYIREYFRQLAIITPYADITADLPEEKDEKNYLVFKRVIDELPKPPEVVRIHPWGTDISTFRREMSASDEMSVRDFLVNSFMGVSEVAADEFCEVVGVDRETSIKELTSQEIRRIVHDGFNRALKEAKQIKRKRDRVFKFDEPSGHALSPLGGDRLRRGLEKELEPDFVEAVSRPARAYEGHPFIIEAAIGYGGGVNSAAASKGATVVDNRVIYRYANRIPLIFGAGNDLITQEVNGINWSDYGLTRGTEPLAIAVSLVSTKIPFPETSKEYIATVTEISEEVRLVLMQLGRKLKTYLGRKRRRARERQRKSRFDRYAPQTVTNLLAILEKEELWDPTTGVNPERIIAALSSGKPRIGSNVAPYGIPVYHANIWSKPEIIQKLQKNNIFETASFLREGNKKLARFLRISEADVDLIKRRTIDELEATGELVEFDTSVILDPAVERRFHKKVDDKSIDLPRLNKALYKRWIRNTFDYIVSPTDKLLYVHGLAIKLMEQERYRIIKKLTEPTEDEVFLSNLASFVGNLKGRDEQYTFSVDDLSLDFMFKDDEIEEEVLEKPTEEPVAEKKEEEIKIVLEDILPPLSYLLEVKEIKERKAESLLELLFEITHPSVPMDEKFMATILIPYFKTKLVEMVNENKEFEKIKVSVSSQAWIDGYLRNAFKRRKINTVKDVITTDDDKLLEIGELQRTLYSSLLKAIVPTSGKIDPEEFNAENAKKKIGILKKAGIKTFEMFAAKTSLELVEEGNLTKYVELLLEESKDKVIEYLTGANKLGYLDEIKIINPELENELFRLNISTTTDLLRTHLNNVLPDFQERIIYAKQQAGHNFAGFNKTQQSMLAKVGVYTLEDLVYLPDIILEQEDLTETQKEKLESIILDLYKPVTYLSPNLVFKLKLLRDAGITTIGKFLVWPSSDLARITDLNEGWIKLVKESFEFKSISKTEKSIAVKVQDYPNLFDASQLGLLEEMAISHVQELSQIKWGDILPSSIERYQHIKKANDALTSPLEHITELIVDEKVKKYFRDAVEDLVNNGVKTVLQFLQVPHDNLRKFVKAKRKRDATNTIYQDIVKQEPEHLPKDSDLYKAVQLNKLLHKLYLPVAFLDKFSSREVELLAQNEVKSLEQVLTLTENDIVQILGTRSNFPQKLAESELVSQGTLLYTLDAKNNFKPILTFEKDGIEYFQSDEIIQLINSRYSTVESLYYTADKQTFEVSGLNWGIISHYRKLLQSPLVLISWKYTVIEEKVIEPEEEGAEPKTETIEKDLYETFTSKELEVLSDNNISRVIDFLTAEPERIRSLLKWDDAKVFFRQKNVILQEAGINLSDLEIFRNEHINHLNELGLVTIEDLYFATSEETWDSQVLPWKSILTIKNVLHLGLHNAVEELTQEMVDLLLDNDVNTILDLYLTGDPILEQKTGLPAERFENLKFALDIGALIEAFDKSVLFTPGLNFFQTQDLRMNKFEKIIDIILADNKEVAKIIGISEKEMDLITNDISRTSVLKTEEERGILLKDITAFSRSEVRSITRSGIFEMNEMDTLQEVLYQISERHFQGEQYLFELVHDLQKVCTTPLAKIGDLNPNEVKLLKKYKIITIADALMIGYEDIDDDTIAINALSSVTKSLMNLRPLIAMGQIPTHTAMKEGTDETSLLDAWLSENPKLHKRTMNNIRSILLIPAKLTRYVKEMELPIDTLENKSLADILLEYHPMENTPEYVIKQKLREEGYLIKLLREGSTPISLLELQPEELRGLLKDSVFTVERAIMNDPKYLSTITGTTQKYWRELVEIFDPEMFDARMEDIGIKINTINLDQESKEQVRDLEIVYLEKVMTFGKTNPVIVDLQNFLFSSSIFLTGTPGEREIADNLNAQSVLEAIVALRNSDISTDILEEIVSVAWNAFKKNMLEIPAEFYETANKRKLSSLQDLIHFTILNPDFVEDEWSNYVQPYLKSPLLLPLDNKELEEIVNKNRCSRIIDAITSPMVFGKISQIKQAIKDGKDLSILEEISLDNSLLMKDSKALYNRFAEQPISLQEILSSPRTLREYKGIRQTYWKQGRDFLKTPLSRFRINDDPIFANSQYQDKYIFLEELIYDIPSIYAHDASEFEYIKGQLYHKDLDIVKDYELTQEIQMACETSFNVPINGYHALYANSLNSMRMLKAISTIPAEKIKKMLLNGEKSIACIPEAKPVDLWNFWKHGITTISDLLLTPIKFDENSVFTKKQIRELRKSAMDILDQDLEDPILSIRELLIMVGSQEIYSYSHSLSTYYSQNSHVLIKSELDKLPNILRKVLDYPFLLTGIADNLDLDELKQIMQAGIYSIADFIFYPEELTKLPKPLTNKSDRLVQITENLKSERALIKGTDLDLGDTLKQAIDYTQSDITDLVFKAINNNRIGALLETRLNYTKLPAANVAKLNQSGILTILDYLIVAPSRLSSITETPVEEIIGFIKSINLDNIGTKLGDTPLKISATSKLSQTTKDYLESLYLHTYLDLKMPISDKINRSDSNYLQQVYTILESDPRTLIPMEGYNQELLSKIQGLGFLSVRDVIRNYQDLGVVTEALGTLNLETLLELVEKNRSFAQLDGVLVKEDKILRDHGIFTYNQLAECTIEKIAGIGLDQAKFQDILEKINSNISNILDFSLDGIDEDLTVAELLSSPSYFDLKLPDRIKIQQSIKLAGIYDPIIQEKLPKINTLGDFLSAKKPRELFKAKDEDITKVVAALNLPVKYLSTFKSTWISKLVDTGITRLWQYLIHPENELANICNSSLSAQLDMKNSMNLNSVLEVPQNKIPALNNSQEMFNAYGYFEIMDLELANSLEQFIAEDSEFGDLRKKYLDNLEVPIWRLSKFWMKDEIKQLELARAGDTIYDLFKANVEGADTLLLSVLQEEFISEHQLEDWCSEDLYSELEKQGIHIAEAWMFHDMKSGEERARNFEIFRAAISQVPSLRIKHITSGIHNKITHISDMFTMEKKDIAKALSTTSSFVSKLFEDVKSSNLVTTSLTPIGLLNEKRTNNIIEAKISSWLQFLGNIRKDEMERIPYMTMNIRDDLLSRVDVPIWHIVPLREMGLETMKKLTAEGIFTVFDLLAMSDRLQEILPESVDIPKLMLGISTSVLNKGKSHETTRLSTTRKIKASDLVKYEALGLNTPLDIFIERYDKEKAKDIQDGIDEWNRLGDMIIENVDYPDDDIKKLKEGGITTIREAVVSTDKILNSLGISYPKIKLFRKDLHRKKGREIKAPEPKPKKKPAKKATKKAASKPAKATTKKATKKVASEPAKSTTKKSTKKTTKKATSKPAKSTTKKTTKKAASKPAKSTTKKPTKKPTKKSTKKSTTKPTRKKPTKKAKKK